MHRCNGCDSGWTGYAMAHCPGCHETFSTVANFDKHIDKNFQHVTPESVGLEQNARGTWKAPDERDISDIHKEKR